MIIRDKLEQLFPRLKKLPRLLGQAVAVTKLEELTPEQRQLMEKFREGIAEALGVPPEAIREDVLIKWVTEWSKAFIKPEYLTMYPEVARKLSLF